MDNAARKLIEDLGGYHRVSLRLGKKPQTVHTAMQSGQFPAAWFDALCELATEAKIEAPARSLFSFVELKPAPGPAFGCEKDCAA